MVQELSLAASKALTPSALGGQAQYLTFTLSGEVFAVPIQYIKEIIEYGGLTEVPMMPGVIRGVINLRGSVVPVVDLSIRFGRDPTETGRRSCIVIIEAAADSTNRYLGIIVDAVNEVLEIDAADIEPAPTFGAKVRVDFIHAMGKIAGKFVIMLDVSQVLSLDEIGEMNQQLQAPESVENGSIH